MIDVAIIGGGPVGLYLAGLLLQDGVSVRIFEQRPERSQHSRAIGIHPPALEALDVIGCADRLISHGVAIGSGRALSSGRQVAAIDFSSLPSPYPFVLSSPQAMTETVLEERVLMLDGGALKRGHTVTGRTEQAGRGEIALTVAQDGRGEDGGGERVAARFCVVASGARSAVLPVLTGVQKRSRERRYQDCYVMGDFADTTEFGSEAVLFLERHGIVESFPLPGRIRRWVTRVDNHDPGRTAEWLADVVQSRTGIAPDARSCSMISSFRVRSSLLPQLLDRHTAVIGDAAHELSPIGGQGMNLGWLDAVALAPLIKQRLAGTATQAATSAFERSRRAAARRAAVQSEINMALGRPAPAALLTLRNRVLGSVANVPAANRYIARRFTML